MGASTDSLDLWFRGNAYSAITATGGIEEYPHNIFAETIAELGIPCFVLFLFMLGQTVRSILWLYRRYSDDPEIRIAIASLAALFTYEFFLTNKQGIFGVTYFYFR